MNATGRMETVIDVLEVDGRDYACVRPSGEIDLANAEEFGAAITSPECAAAAGILVDLTQVDFMDSSGLRIMLLSAREGKAGFATIIDEESAVATLFEMVDVREKLNVASSQDEAIEKLQAGADAAG